MFSLSDKMIVSILATITWGKRKKKEKKQKKRFAGQVEPGPPDWQGHRDVHLTMRATPDLSY